MWHNKQKNYWKVKGHVGAVYKITGSREVGYEVDGPLGTRLTKQPLKSLRHCKFFVLSGGK